MVYLKDRFNELPSKIDLFVISINDIFIMKGWFDECMNIVTTCNDD